MLKFTIDRPSNPKIHFVRNDDRQDA